MKDQIMQIETADPKGNVITITLKEDKRCAVTYMEGSEKRSAPLRGNELSAMLDKVSALAAESPDAAPAEPPCRSTVTLRDGTVLHLPYEKLSSIAEDAWYDAQCELAKTATPSLMGLVACQTPPVPMGTDGLAGMSMGSFAGMQAASQPPKKSVRTDKDTWNCGCGQNGLHSKFCPECGSAAPPVFPEKWDCPNCGAKDLTGKFCPECGTPVPV